MSPLRSSHNQFGVRFFALFCCLLLAFAIPAKIDLFFGLHSALPLAAIILIAPFATGIELLVLVVLGAFLFSPPQLSVEIFSFFLFAPFIVRFFQRYIHMLDGFFGNIVFVCLTILIYYVIANIKMFLIAPSLIAEDVFLSLLFCVMMFWVLHTTLDDLAP